MYIILKVFLLFLKVFLHKMLLLLFWFETKIH